jgi:hypothetical protein
MIFFSVGCNNVAIKDVHVKNAAMWAVVNMEGSQVLLQNVNVDTAADGITHDGIDLVDCHDALVDGATVSAGDDAICLKSGSPIGLQNVRVQNCHVLSSGSNGIKFGTASSGFFKDVSVDNVALQNVAQAAMAVESVDGAAVQNIAFNHIRLHDTGTPLFVLLGQRAASKSPVGTIDGLSFFDVSGDAAAHNWGSVITGTVLPTGRHPLQNISLSNVHIECWGGLSSSPPALPEYEGQYPDPRMWSGEGKTPGPAPASGLYIRHVDGLTLHDVTMTSAAPDARPPTALDDVSYSAGSQPLGSSS